MSELIPRRLQSMRVDKYRNVFKLILHESSLSEILSWKKSTTIFVCSMSDFFHENVPFEFIDRVMATITSTPQHKYQILTKRAENMSKYFETRPVPQKAWIGVMVDIKTTKDKIDYLRTIPACIRFLSCEPLLEDVGKLNLVGIDWVVVGGEGGSKARLMKEKWVLSIYKRTSR